MVAVSYLATLLFKLHMCYFVAVIDRSTAKDLFGVKRKKSEYSLLLIASKTLDSQKTMATEEQLHQIFNLLDSDAKGYITESDLRSASQGHNNNIEDIIALLNMSPKEKLSFGQFCRRIQLIGHENNEEIFEGNGNSSIISETPMKTYRKPNQIGTGLDVDKNVVGLMKLIMSRLDELVDQQQCHDLRTSNCRNHTPRKNGSRQRKRPEYDPDSRKGVYITYRFMFFIIWSAKKIFHF